MATHSMHDDRDGDDDGEVSLDGDDDAAAAAVLENLVGVNIGMFRAAGGFRGAPPC